MCLTTSHNKFKYIISSLIHYIRQIDMTTVICSWLSKHYLYSKIIPQGYLQNISKLLQTFYSIALPIVSNEKTFLRNFLEILKRREFLRCIFPVIIIRIDLCVANSTLRPHCNNMLPFHVWSLFPALVQSLIDYYDVLRLN